MSRPGSCVLMAMAVACLAACTEGPPVETGPQLLAIPPPTSPENLVQAIEVIFNDTVRSAEARVEEFGKLFAPEFTHRFSPDDIGGFGGWGLEREIAQAQRLVEARERGNLVALGLSVTHDPVRELYPPEEGREGWKGVFVTRLERLLVLRPGYDLPEDIHWRRTPRRDQVQIKFSPAPDGSRWFIAEWVDLPRP